MGTLNVDIYVKQNEEKLSKMKNYLINAVQITKIDGKRYQRQVKLQAFVQEDGRIELLREV